MPNNFKIDMNGNGLKIAIVSARFNEVVTRQLMLGAVETLDRYGVEDDDISIAWVPGSFELPVVAKAFAETGKYDAIICLGAVIRGETDHYNMVANQSASGIASVGRETGVPTIFGVLTTAAGLLQTYYTRPIPQKNDLLEKLLELKKKSG